MIRLDVMGPSSIGRGDVVHGSDPLLVFTLAIDAPSANAVRLRLFGHLDDTAAREVLHVAADVVQCGCSRLVLDLDGLLSWDDAAAFAVVGCARLAPWLPEGVTIVAARGPGQELADLAGLAISA